MTCFPRVTIYGDAGYAPPNSRDMLTRSFGACFSLAREPPPTTLPSGGSGYLEPAVRAVARARGRQRVAAAGTLRREPRPAVGAVLPMGRNLSLAVPALLHEPAKRLEELGETRLRFRPLCLLFSHLPASDAL